MKQLTSFLFIVCFLTIPVFADGDMGAGGRPPETVSTKITTSLDSENRREDASTDIFLWVYKQIFELID